ncbi:MAG: MFS transporter [Armatimonadota bacterium]|nr:MFS transporter [Armatimonadota bacterium]MDR7563470.1 MFS transporter [Armatimonadota bacterium]MDR7567742.1 MFS transporter [Armatimonadota bacterium]
MGRTRAIEPLAFRFVLLMGAVSLFADATYEGARGITGPYLGALGASAAVVGFVAGLGELLGYALRLASGALADRTQRYWLLTFLGYLVNLGAVPALALAGRWEVAAVLLVGERIGKALRTPPRDTMLSHATSQVGHGWGFGVHEALDQVGAVAGPLLVAGILAGGSGYRTAFAVLLVPALVSLAFLTAARAIFPRPRAFEIRTQSPSDVSVPRELRWYMVGAGLIAAGYVDFSLLSFHFVRTGTVSATVVALLYAFAQASDALAALLGGRWFDRAGVRALVAFTLLAIPASPLGFLGETYAAVLAGVLWGVGIGVQESLLRAAVARLAPPDRRASAFGLFHAAFGTCWFAGSALMGVLYELNPTALVAFSVTCQLAALPFFAAAGRALRPGHG